MMKIGNKTVIQYTQLMIPQEEIAEIELVISEKDKSQLQLEFKSDKKTKDKQIQLTKDKNGIAKLTMTNWDSPMGTGHYFGIGSSDDGQKISVILVVYSIGPLKKVDMEFLIGE